MGDEHQPIWELEEPSLEACSICGVPLGAIDGVLEVRNSGRDGKKQVWIYCEPCFQKGKPISKEGISNFLRQYKETFMLRLALVRYAIWSRRNRKHEQILRNEQYG